MDIERFKEKLTHPVTALTGFAAALFTDPFVLLDALISTVASTTGLWYPLIGGISRLGSIVGWIPADLARQLLLAGLVVYISVYAARFLGALREDDNA